MPSLKDYRDRIASVKSTKKITSAMKMVAASKLKKAQDQAEASQPYAAKMAAILDRLSQNIEVGPQTSQLMTGTGKEDVHLLVVMTSDRGLCGGFNTNAIRQAMQKITSLQNEGKQVKLLLVGSKGYDGLKRSYESFIADRFPTMVGKQVAYEDADKVRARILELFEEGEFDVCTLIYNRFQSVIAQKPTLRQLIPFKPSEEAINDNAEDVETELKALYEFEPNEEVILDQLLPQNLGVQIFGALLDSAAGEQASRMTAMDNATRNAGDMIGSLTLEYNRVRQAYITKELIEIISGAEAV